MTNLKISSLCTRLKRTVDCIWSDFGPWSKCSKTCGFGTQVRKRFFAVAATGPSGTPCLGAPTQQRSCNQKDCLTTTTRRPTTTTTRTPTTSTTVKSTTSGTTPMLPITTFLSNLDVKDLAKFCKVAKTFCALITSTNSTTTDSSPKISQTINDIPISETTTPTTTVPINLFEITTLKIANFEGLDSSTTILKTTLENTTDTVIFNMSTTTPFIDTFSPLPDLNITEPHTPKNFENSVNESFAIDYNEIDTFEDELIEVTESNVRVKIDKIKSLEENEIPDVGLNSIPRALTNTTAYPEANIKQTSLVEDASTTLPPQFKEDNATATVLEQPLKVIDTSNSTVKVSKKAISATNIPIGNSSVLPSKTLIATPSLVTQLEDDKLVKESFFVEEPKKEDNPLNQTKDSFSPFVSLNGVGDLDSE